MYKSDVERDLQSGDLRRARNYVIGLLGRRDYSRKQLEDKLKTRGLSAADAKVLLDELILEGWFREDAFKKARTRQLLRRGLAPRLVKSKLRSDKIALTEEDIAHAYGELGVSQNTQLKEAMAKQVRRLRNDPGDERATKQKIIQALIRKGYSISDILTELKKA